MENLLAKLLCKTLLHLLTTSGRGGGNGNWSIWISLHHLLNQRSGSNKFPHAHRMKPYAAGLLWAFDPSKSLPPALAIGRCFARTHNQSNQNEWHKQGKNQGI